MNKITVFEHLRACAEAAKNYASGLVGELAQTVTEAIGELESVKANGTFPVIGQEVTDAYLSDSGKYLMIYKDTQTNEQNELHKQEIVEQFQGFKAE